jgi:hypothetical protein
MSAQLRENARLTEVPVTTVFDQNGRPSISHMEPQLTIEPKDICGSNTGQELPNVRQKLSKLLSLPSIAISFEKATEGRPYSLALRLRELGFQGEIHAVGAINQELLHHLVRVGFTHFHLPRVVKAISPEVIHPFSFSYQHVYEQTNSNPR